VTARGRWVNPQVHPAQQVFLRVGRTDSAECPAVRLSHDLEDNETMSGIQFVTDDKGRKVAVQIDLKRYGAVLEDFWDGLISESRRKDKGIPIEKIKADLLKRGRLRE
jgi:hypothetical protein